MQQDSYYFEGENAKLKKFILENDAIVPQAEIESFWGFMDKENELTNFDKNDIKIGLLWYDIAKINLMRSMPSYQFTYPLSRMIDQGRWKFLVKAKRSTGDTQRERALLATEFRELRIPEKQKSGGGFLGMFGGRR
jgi:hypothetical protein